MIGKTISHYKILEEIGSGGMGIVYKAEDTKLKRTVALKFLPPEFSRDKEAKKRFLHEAQAAAAIEHPNICPVYEINETKDGQMYIVMAYYKGETLRDKIASGPLPIGEAIDITIQIARGLERAHESDIIHRDIKSANIFITERNDIRILDFGLAKLRGQTKLTRESTTLGTVAYMSPEQTTGEEVDQRSDIWSLGVVFYEMLTGQLPFKGHYEQAIVYSILNEEPGAINQLIEDIPPDLEQIIKKMLAKDPEKRYPNLNDFLVDIKRFKKGKELKEIVAEPKSKFSLKSLTLGILFLAVIIIGAYFIFKGKAEPDIPPVGSGSMPSLAIVHFENNSGDEKLDNWRNAFSELLTTDLAQSKYIKVLRSDEIYGIFKKLNLLEAKRYSTEDLQNIAERGKVNHILKGSYIKDEDNFIISTMLLKADTGETISSLSVRARKGEIFSNVDHITREIKSKLNLSKEQISGDIDKEVGKITTSSPEAYQYYLEGRKSFSAGEYRKSITIMEKAIKIDPEFAMAYRSMAWASGMLHDVSKWDEFMKKAVKFSHRLPDRERYYIQGDFYRGSEKTWDKALDAYKKVIQLYPQDLHANFSAAMVYSSLGETDKMIERYEALVQNHPNPSLHANLSNSYQDIGKYDKARKILENFINNVQDHWYIRWSFAKNYYFQRKFDLALIEADKAVSLSPKSRMAHQIKGDIYFFKGDFSKAEKTFRKLLEFKEPIAQIDAIQSIGAVYMTRGRLADAESQFNRALKLAKDKSIAGQDRLRGFIGYIYFISKRYDECLKEFNIILDNYKDYPRGQGRPLYFTAIAYLEKNSLARTQTAEADLLEWANNRMNKKFIRLYYLFRGKKELKQKNLSGAIEYLNKAPVLSEPLESKWSLKVWFLDSLARAYLDSGNMVKAQNMYEKITLLTSARYYTGDVYAKAFYELGKIFQQKGQKEKAIQNYNKLINLWENCDSIFQPLVEDARKRVKDLAHSSQPPAPSQE